MRRTALALVLAIAACTPAHRQPGAGWASGTPLPGFVSTGPMCIPADDPLTQRYAPDIERWCADVLRLHPVRLVIVIATKAQLDELNESHYFGKPRACGVAGFAQPFDVLADADDHDFRGFQVVMWDERAGLPLLLHEACHALGWSHDEPRWRPETCGDWGGKASPKK